MGITAAQLSVAINATGADTTKAQVEGVSSSVDKGAASIRSFAIGAAVVGAAALIGIGVASVKMAGDFQAGMTSLVTGAGESQKNIKMVSDGILAMAPAVGTTTKALTDGMYMIESAGFHGADGLQVLKAAAEGAKVGNADLASVANGVTTALTDYAMPASKATEVTNTLVATVAAGKTHMTDLAQSLSSILPTASAAGVSLRDTAGAMATMTGEGTPAADAATYLRQTIMSLENPAKKGADALRSIGLSSSDVASEMKKSLPDTLTLITDHLKNKFPEGSAAYVKALADIAGGSKQMQGVLELTGSHLDTFKGNVSSISDAVKKGGDSITGWTNVQSTFNFKMDQAKATLETLGIKIGTALLPALGKLMDGFSSPAFQSFATAVAGFVTGALLGLINGIQKVVDVGSNLANFFEKNHAALATLQTVLIPVAGAIAGILVFAFWSWAAAAGAAAVATLAAAWPFLLIGAAIAGLVAGFLYLYNNVKPFRDFMNQIGAVVKQAAQAVVQFAEDIASRVAPIISGWIKALTPLVQGFMTAWNQAWPMILAVLKGVWDEIQGVVKIAWALISGYIKIGLDILGGNWKQAWNDFKDMLKGVWDGIKQWVKGGIEALVGMFKPLLEAMSNIPGPAGDMAKSVLKSFGDMSDGASQSANDMKSKTIQATIDMQDKMVKNLDNTRQQLIQKMKDTSDPVQKHALEMQVGVTTQMENLHKNALDKATDMKEKLVGHSIIPDMINSIISWFGNLPQGAMNALQSLPGKLTDFWNGIINNATNAGTNIVNGIANGIKGAIGAVGDAMNSVTSFISSHLPHSPAKIGPLTDLGLQGSLITEQLSQGMLSSLPKLQTAIGQLVKPIAMQLSPASNPSITMPGLTTIPSQLSNQANITVVVNSPPLYLNGQLLANGLMPYMANAIRYSVATKM